MRGSSSYPPQFGGYPKPDPPEDDQDFLTLLTPKTVVQLAVWILMFGLGAGLSGLILFVIYQGQVNDLRSELLESQEQLRESLEQRIGGAPASEESPNLNVSATPAPDPTKEIVDAAAPAIVGVVGRDSAGGSVTGSGFVVNSTDGGTWVVTSHDLVAGVQDFTGLRVRHKSSALSAEVYESDPGRGLALVIYQVPAERSLRFSRSEEPKEGDQVWALGNTRESPYAAGLPAKLTSVSAGSLGLDIKLPASYLGGPLIDAEGRVLGVLTSDGETGSATPIELACQRVLRCPGSRRTGSTPAPSPSPAAGPAEPAAEPPPPAEPGAVTEPPPSNPNTTDVPIG